MTMRVIASLCLAFYLTACATVSNPLTPNRLVQLESAYGVALAVAVGYYELYKVNRCTVTRPESPTNYCARRSIVVKLQQADIRAQAALQAARKFVINNPNLDATAIISAAETAIAAFQQIEQQSGVR